MPSWKFSTRGCQYGGIQMYATTAALRSVAALFDGKRRRNQALTRLDRGDYTTPSGDSAVVWQRLKP